MGLTATSAHASDPQDAIAATAQNTADQAAANLAFSLYAASTGVGIAPKMLDGSGANVSCSKPVVYGIEVTRHHDLVVAETHQADQAFATATCVDLSGGSFTASLAVRIEYCALRTSLTTCSFATVGVRTEQFISSMNGAAPMAVSLPAIYSDAHAALGKIRRVLACVRTSVTGPGCVTYDYSGTYGY